MKKRLIIIISIVVVIIIGIASYFTISSRSIESKTYAHLLSSNNAEVSEIKDVIVKYSIINSLLFSNEWTIAVEYYDEPDVFYMYSYRDNLIEFAGVAGGEINKDKSEYMHLEQWKSEAYLASKWGELTERSFPLLECSKQDRNIIQYL